jgi:hypothetical protein
VVALEHFLVEVVLSEVRVDVEQVDHASTKAGLFVELSDDGVRRMLAVVDATAR